MGVSFIPHTFKPRIPIFILLVCVVLPSMAWGGGFHEEKLFDTIVYSSQELRQKVVAYTKTIEQIDAQIKALETEIDWLVLKINQILDAGRQAPSALKQAIANHEKKVVALQRSKKRYEHLIEHYSAAFAEKKIPDAGPSATPAPSETMETSSKTAPNPLPRIEKSMDTTQAVTSELQAAIKKSGLSDWVQLSGEGTCLRMETTLPILFSTGSARLASEYNSFFKKLAIFLKPYDVKVLVNGYADTVPIKNKTFPSNFELGSARAANIVHKLVHYGLAPSIFKIETTGQYRFAARQMSRLKSLERRAEVTVIFSG